MRLSRRNALVQTKCPAIELAGHFYCNRALEVNRRHQADERARKSKAGRAVSDIGRLNFELERRIARCTDAEARGEEIRTADFEVRSYAERAELPVVGESETRTVAREGPKCAGTGTVLTTSHQTPKVKRRVRDRGVVGTGYLHATDIDIRAELPGLVRFPCLLYTSDAADE